jgi:hypothetical protein
VKRRPLGGGGAGDRISQSKTTDSAPDPQALRCAGCGAAGRPPTIVWDRSKEPPDVVLTPAFGWYHDGRPALLCSDCKAKAAKARKTGRRR